ncbi:MAG: UDP-3-O-(3-hydroxymyristoyl)glucosamine N-acyltransferase [Candidatus Omnitrophica bacterium]|nr:UDP-3-O-(3-hydroxymyristoyl)glucosamine N-acyltransferase [Candidatus Omnitrophota bacterium]MDD5352862.1 UDP-3-O-(3-hydroxymyristoyl)glucosamine N-acyltransferase [Candidatus Omnitrophota bacterium]MDD5550461.1 UDP-3-O-(3-hydroxymyristoyl)glucosamine N-acyltransferase [Candidatus Omnitrophota bacterium]
MKKLLREIADLLGAEVIGDPDVVITGVASVKEAKKGDITFISNPKYLPFINETKASAVIASAKIEGFSRPVVKTNNPSLAFAKVVSLFNPPKNICNKGVHPSAVLGKDVKLGKDIAIGPYAVIEDGVSIGDRSIINSGVYIGYDTSIGEDCFVYSNVSIREKTSIGNRVIIHNGTVIGSDGFGYDTIDKVHHKIPQLGCVVIDDDVEIGANVAIDRARFDKTRIGKGTKIDNLVHIAHNVVTGENCIIVAQVGISGSVSIGNNVTIAGQAGLSGHITIGDNVIIGGQAGVTKSVPANNFVSGYPAKPHKEATKINAYIQRLPRLNETVAELKARLDKIEPKKNTKHGKSKNSKKSNRS